MGVSVLPIEIVFCGQSQRTILTPPCEVVRAWPSGRGAFDCSTTLLRLSQSGVAAILGSFDGHDQRLSAKTVRKSALSGLRLCKFDTPPTEVFQSDTGDAGECDGGNPALWAE